MIMFVVVQNYAQFNTWLRAHFPYLSRGIRWQRYFLPVYDEETFERCMSVERNMPVVFVGGDYNWVSKLKDTFPGRDCLEFQLVSDAGNPDAITSR